MQTALRMETTVLPGNRVEVSAPELPTGAKVEVTVVLLEKATPKFSSAFEFLETLPMEARAFVVHDESIRGLQLYQHARNVQRLDAYTRAAQRRERVERYHWP